MARKDYTDFAGFRKYVRNRVNGSEYVLVDNNVAKAYDPAGGRWITTCETHGTICNHETLALATGHLPYGEWCEECQAEIDTPRFESSPTSLEVSEVEDRDRIEFNQRKYAYGMDGYPCLICGAPVREGGTGHAFWYAGGGTTIVTEAEYRRLEGEGDAGLMGIYPIGNNCYRKHREVLEPFRAGGY